MRVARKKTFSFLYLFQPEDSTGLHSYENQAGGVLKVLFWTGMSFMMSVGISQLI
ncbi:hypothetical protein [Pseudodesulfovibrio tunisiensis]|uniref:hypothetical protein n=1 Tax=Pseudodesulfovibrio tunisiensis TaxID=463192 RepID=UPI001FB23F65|nr:hypothetical protein [Pseudodesulfovibrio tunisiensis]